MKIGIDARLYSETGIGRYVRNLIRELEKIDNENDYIIFVNKPSSEIYRPLNPRFKKWLIDYPVYSVEEQTLLLSEYLRARLDVLHVPHFNVPLLYHGKVITTVHDLTMDENNPMATNQNSLIYKIKFFGEKIALNRAVKKSRYVITPSEHVKNMVVKKFGLNADKVKVTYEGVDSEILKNIPSDHGVLKAKLEKYPLKRDYLLYVGNVYPHKNLNTFLVAYKSSVDAKNTSLQFVIVGKVDPFMQRLAAFVKGLKIQDYVVFASKYHESGFVDDAELAYLYKGAFAYVIPSKKEGFSITPLEAQAIGVPVICSDIPAHKEILGESAYYFNPESNIDMTEKLKIFEKDEELRNDLIKKGFENVKRFSWEKMAKETLNIYKDSLTY